MKLRGYVQSATSVAFASLLFFGFVIAYGAAAIGMLGFLSSWKVAPVTLSGATIAFVAMVGYFFVELRRLSKG
ncbi:hypothetical protein JQ617_07010 [Bradyrhizobium sp. KB893862 SZCCT0404]|uniref:hypothetical protein n=1 Tax=Bradyrhizobium sp. KB893862 SZCCT0404 TaxID=2807672 RepID=UPI001BA71599|nr:hypothetical protein [Bradyrhizobium sp. KB893862 SZCCT0404]MBR1173700.1 hypothetical protein [Bradyrhizobium sp. KB893862 SZCCT0404]